MRQAIEKSLSETSSNDSLRVAMCEVGLGVFAERDFSAGEKVLEYVGPVISFTDAIAKGDREGDAFQIGIDAFIDPEPPGLYVNHSCAPNTGIFDGRSLHALTAIRRGEELRFDYSTVMYADGWKMPCRCGAKSCRGTVQAFENLPCELQRTYIELGIVPDFIRELFPAKPLTYSTMSGSSLRIIDPPAYDSRHSG